MPGALLRLRAALAALPVDAPAIALVLPRPEPTKAAPVCAVTELRAATGEWLLQLSIHIDETLAQAMADVETRWDTFDSVPLAPPHLRARGLDLREAWRPWLRREPLAATEAMWTVDAVLALVGTLEQRLAALVRAQVARPGGRLLCSVRGGGSRPFLDLGQAVGEVARAWS